jgi:hypothetical protein
MKTINTIWVLIIIAHNSKIMIKILTKIMKLHLKMKEFIMIQKKILMLIKIQIILQMIQIFNKMQNKIKILYIWIMINQIVIKTI